MLEELGIMGLVEKLNYSGNKPEISDRLNGSSVDSDVYDKLYYILNASNRGSQLILEDYKRNCTTKEMLNITKKRSEYSSMETASQ